VTVLLGIRLRFHDHASRSSSSSGWCFTSRQPISLGATWSERRQKKAWGRCWGIVVAMGVAWGLSLSSS
jgi:hypothetical protein